ncbi:MAG: hypothetical protein JRJ35_11730 [Deltaproteobacteria bacterium]|nr:hypothetical protein [Deltaproteobacteria bacterium]MBW1924133.1 hypothetical protein [Deltaproteobacteria bacterium]MBW1950074.1 hypothetical protein [Deltaproteobacteria bacterium]MBW2009328.1 hypothetical protein [Deltaproteobacteria bacterium]MBW2102254.1 hypothetical protein [Deltaproteobacteria bacterium]
MNVSTSPQPRFLAGGSAAAWIFWAVLCLTAALFPPAHAHCQGPSGAGLTFQDGLVSARLQDEPLESVLARIEKEKNVWFKGIEACKGRSVTVEFSDLPIRQAVERILSSTNYCLVFDKGGRLKGVFILGGPSGATSRVPARSGPRRKSLPRRRR